MYTIFVINPGSTSTKLALYEDEQLLWEEVSTYSSEQLASFPDVLSQYEMRMQDIQKVLEKHKVNLSSLSAVVSRGGAFKPLESGTYEISSQLVEDVKNGKVIAHHASNLGVLLAYRLSEGNAIPAYFADPVCVDEMIPEARISGLPELERKSLLHALNIKAVARKVASQLQKDLSQLHFIVGHLGGGISICAIQNGRIIDVNNALEGGPFSPERAGSLPVSSLVRLCYSGKYTYQVLSKKIVGQGGLVAHLGTNDAREVEKRIETGDPKAELIYRAMAYQIAKEVGSMATVLAGRIDGIIFTGELARSKMLMEWIQERISFLGPIFLYPGNFEMEALALAGLRVLRGEEKVKPYS